MENNDNILKIIYTSIDLLNEDLEQDEQITKAETAVLFGPESVIDSIGLVNLISSIEEILEDELDVYVSLADENVMSLEESPFKTVTTLKEYIKGRIDAEQ